MHTKKTLSYHVRFHKHTQDEKETGEKYKISQLNKYFCVMDDTIEQVRSVIKLSYICFLL